MKRDLAIGVLMLAVLPCVVRAQDPQKAEKELATAVQKGDVAKLRQVLDSSPTSQASRDAALLAFAGSGTESAVSLLLGKGASPNGVDRDGQTVLMAAVLGGSGGAIQTLLEAGADPKAVAKSGDSAMTLVSLRVQRPVRIGGFIATQAVCLDETPAAVVKAIIEHGGNVNARGPRQVTALTRAADCGHVETMRTLIEGGADIGAVDADGNDALMMAAGSGVPDAVRLLLDKGAQVGKKNVAGSTPLVEAGRQMGGCQLERCVQTVALLLDRGSDINAQDQLGNTALMYAASVGASDRIVKLLLDRGADTAVKNMKGETVAKLAKGPAKKLLVGR